MFSKQFSRAFVFVLLVGLALSFSLLTACGSDDDDDDDDPGLPVVDDDDDDDIADDDDDIADDDDDDDTDSGVESVEIQETAEMTPAGIDVTYSVLVTFTDTTTEVNPDGVSWEIADENVATVDEGVVTGVADGATTLTATYPGAKASDTVDILIGPDVFTYDMFNNTVDALDREAETYLADYYSIGTAGLLLNHLIFFDGTLYYTDSGDFDGGTVGDEKILAVDPITGGTSDITLDIVDPWNTAVYNGSLYTTGNLSDELSIVSLADTTTKDYVDLPADCVPTGLAGANDKIYVSCSGFDAAYFTYGDVLAIYDPSTKGVSQINLGTVNPGSIHSNADGTFVYVIAVGDYYAVFGHVYKIDTATDTVDSDFALGGSLGASTMTPDGRILVLDAQSMYVIDTANSDTIVRGEANPISIGNAGDWLAAIAYCEDDDSIYVSAINFTTFANAIYVLDGTDYSLKTTYDLSTNANTPAGIACW